MGFRHADAIFVSVVMPVTLDPRNRAYVQATPTGVRLIGTKEMYWTTDKFYTAAWATPLYLVAATFVVWAIILTFIALF